MANGEYLRGEVYWVRLDYTIGSEEGTGRPGVIISSNSGNENNKTVVVAFLTTQSNALAINPSVFVNGKKSRVLCNQLQTVDKARLERFICCLSDSEMIRVSGALAIAMCIPQHQTLATPTSKDDTDKVFALKAEADMFKKLYEKTMDQLVEIKMANDLTRKMSEPKQPPTEPTAPTEPSEPTETTEPENTRVEINTCTVEDLMKCGCTIALARLIISYRPYKTVGDLTRVPGLRSTAFQILKHKVCCIHTEEATKPTITTRAKPIENDPGYEIEKVNINTATAKEITEKLGFGSQYYGSKIVGYRNTNGRYVDLEELRDVKGLPKNLLDRYRDRITIDDENSPQQQTDSRKVNVNKMESAQQLKNLTGMSMRCAAALIGHRKKNGSFKTLEELTSVDGFGDIAMKRYGHLLEV